MGQLKLFESTEHLERCEEDPDPYATESIYYTPWYILYSSFLILEYVDEIQRPK